jgi:hypothetical protein
MDDTHPTIRRAQTALLRAMTPARRFAMVEDLTDATILRWIELVYGKDLAGRVAPCVDRLGVRQ